MGACVATDVISPFAPALPTPIYGALRELTPAVTVSAGTAVAAPPVTVTGVGVAVPPSTVGWKLVVTGVVVSRYRFAGCTTPVSGSA